MGDARDRRRPVLAATRGDVIPAQTAILVAPITRRVRSIPTAIRLDERDGLREACAASFDSLQPVPRTALTTRVGNGGAERRDEIFRALAALADC